MAAQVVYSSSRDLDILPAGANKGNALRWLASQVGLAHDKVCVDGDSGNDASMFLVEDVYGILVSNSEEALSEALEGIDVSVVDMASIKRIADKIFSASMKLTLFIFLDVSQCYRIN